MLSCEKGIDFLTMRFVVVLTIAAALIAISAVYVKGYADGASRDMARSDAGRIAELARAEYIESIPDMGDGQTIDVHIPKVVRRIIFGGVGSENSSVGRNANIYEIEYADGCVETSISDARFAYGDRTNNTAMDRPVALFPGEYSLNIRAVTVNGTIEIAVFGGAPC